MKIIKQSFEILTPMQNELELLEWWEKIARVCYKSENRIKPGSAVKLFNKLKYQLKHESIFEHINFTVKFITNRGFTHELVRHRIASFSQQSTRYVIPNREEGISVILPVWFGINTKDEEFETWTKSMIVSENSYFKLLKDGQTPEQARGVLPIDLKTEIVVTANLREWWHILKLRTSKEAHPQIRSLMLDLEKKFKEDYPILFGKEK